MRVNQNILSQNWIKFQKKDKSRISPSFFYHSDVFKTKCGTVEKLFKFENFFAFCTLLASLFCFILTKGSLSLTHTLSLQKLCSNSFTLFSPSQLSEKRKTKSKCTPPYPTPQNIPLIKNRFHFTNREKAQSVHSFD